MLGLVHMRDPLPKNGGDNTLDQSGMVKPELLRRIQGKPLPTATDAEPRIAAYSEYGAGGPSSDDGGRREMRKALGLWHAD